MPRYLYGMRHQRGFGPGCQPSRGLIARENDPAGRYNDVLVYDRELEPREIDTYELDSMGVEPDAGDLISRQQAIDVIKKRLFETAFNNIGIKQNVDETLVDVAEDRLETWFNDVPLIQPDPCQNMISRQAAVECVYKALRTPPLKGVLTDTMSLAIAMVYESSPIQPDTTTHDSNVVKKGGNDKDRTTDDLISRQQAFDAVYKCTDIFVGNMPIMVDKADAYEALAQLPPAQPVHIITLDDVLKHIDGMPEDAWLEFTECLACRGWELQRRTAKWCGGDFA